MALSLPKGVSKRCGFVLALMMLFAGCAREEPRVDAGQYDAFWLWAGVKPQPVLDKAKTIYILEGEVRGGDRPVLHRLRGGTPRVKHADVWLVYRVESIRWGTDIVPQIKSDLARWRRSSGRVIGVQIDFDAATRGLEGYAAFLKTLRTQLPPDSKLGVTGLMDWSSRADPAGLKAVAASVDEIIIQTYQGRETIPRYQNYLRQLDRLNIPYKLGLVQGGTWSPPPALAIDEHFRGYVIFLLNPAGS